MGRDLAAASRVLSPAQLHVVRNCRGWLDGTHRVAGRDQHRACAQTATGSLVQQAAWTACTATPCELDRLSVLWTQAVLRLFPDPLRVNGRRVLVGDGIKVAKSGRKMPGVKLLHQQSDSNTKPEYIMGHSMQAVSILVRAARERLRRPAGRAHSRRPGVVEPRSAYLARQDDLVAGDRLIGQRAVLLRRRCLLRCWQNRQRPAGSGQPPGHTREVQCSRLCPVRASRPRTGRPRLYGAKIKLKSLLSDPHCPHNQLASPVYGAHNVTIQYRVCDLLWLAGGRLVRFVAVTHPSRGSCLLMCTGTSVLDAVEIIRLYGLRFKIEYSFKQAVHRIGTFAYHFWMQDMKPLAPPKWRSIPSSRVTQVP